MLVTALLILLTGGVPALFSFLGYLIYFVFFFIFLLIAGFWGFSYYIRSRISKYEATQSETHNRFVFLLVHILVKTAQADGHFTKAELNTMLNFFRYNLRYNQDQMYWVKQLIKDARDAQTPIETLLEEFRTTFAYEPRLILLELIYQLFYSKGSATAEELRHARDIARFLHISAYDQRTIEAKFIYQQQRETASSAQREERYYAVLGLEPGADFNAVKKAYRTLSMQYHPDKVRHLGEEFHRVAEEKMKDINAAYDYFKRKFNNA